VKISSETVTAGDSAADIRALGVTLVLALTGQAPTLAESGQSPAVEALPFPFREMAQNCLHHDPRLRWSAAKIGAWLRSPERPAPALPASAALPAAAAPTALAAKPAAGKPKSKYYVAAVAVLVVGVAVVGGLVMHRTAVPVPSAAEPVQPAPASAPTVSLPTAQTGAPKAVHPVQPDRHAAPPRAKPAAQAPAQDGIVRRVIPDIPTKARNTVHGKATVVVRVEVDPSGNVARATLEHGGSPYFGKLSLEAARHWQFDSKEGEVPRNWILRFEIMRTGTQVVALRAGRE
jgi:TonB family protein